MESENMFMRRKGISAFFSCALFGISVLFFGGTALAAPAPDVTKLDFKDSGGNVLNLNTGYGASHLDVDSKGNLYVTDPVMNTVSIFNTNGRLIKRFNINKALAVAVDSNKGVIYVGGSLNGVQSVFILDNNDDDKNDNGNLGTNFGYPVDISVSSKGDVYVVDAWTASIKVFDAQGASVEFGPYGGDRYATEVLSGFAYNRTRHKIIPGGIAVDEGRGLLYVNAAERIEFLRDNPCTQRLTEGTTTLTENISYEDTAESWKYYNDVLNIPTASTFKWWCPVTVDEGTKYHILLIDLKTGIVKGKARGDGGKEYIGAGITALQARGLAFDGKDRLYVAATGGSALGGGELRVYDPGTGNLSSSISGFPSNRYLGLAFSPGPSDSDPGKTPGRLFATTGDNPAVSPYSIDGGTNPANTSPTEPGLISPGHRSYVSSRTPYLEISNSADQEGDPLTYTYQISDAAGVAVSAAGIPGGNGGVTSVAVSKELSENGLYRWRAQSYDGFAVSEWSVDAEFCINERNDNPEAPAVVSPADFAPASSFSSSLTWSPSKDPDCYDSLTYALEISGDQGFSTIMGSVREIAGQSVGIGTFSGLNNGLKYYWRVKAVDNNGGESAYSEGSFVYKTTLVKFKSDQPNTKVYIDGNYGYPGRSLGTAPVDVQDITPGSHFVTFIKAGYEPYYTIVDVKDPLKDPTLPVYARMSKASRISLSSTGAVLAGLEVAGPSSPFVVNYTNDIVRLKDGLKDVIAGGGDGKVYLFTEQRQEGGTRRLVPGDAVKADMADINVGKRAVPFVVDYNNDGRNDLLVGSDDGLIYLYISEIQADGTGKLAAKGALRDTDGNSIKVISNSAPTVVDYNGDGNKDLVVGSGDGRLVRYLNSGTDASPQFKASDVLTINADGAVLSIGTNSKAFFADWNSDGKNDLVVGGSSGFVSLFLNVGTDNTPEFKSISGLQQWIKEKKRERGNREFIPYLGYNNDLGDRTNGKGDAAPFVVDWGGSTTRDMVAGNGSGEVGVLVSE